MLTCTTYGQYGSFFVRDSRKELKGLLSDALPPPPEGRHADLDSDKARRHAGSSKAGFAGFFLVVCTALFAASSFAQDPGWHQAEVRYLNLQGDPVRVSLGPDRNGVSIRDKCGEEFHTVRVHRPNLSSERNKAYEEYALFQLSEAMSQHGRVSVYLQEQHNANGARYCVASTIQRWPPPVANTGGGNTGTGTFRSLARGALASARCGRLEGNAA